MHPKRVHSWLVELVGPGLWLADHLRGWQQRRRNVRVLVHRAVFLPSSPEHFFVKVTNLSPAREIEVTHVWFQTEPPVHVFNHDRPLPARLRLDETYETWCPVVSVPEIANVERLGRVRLSNGKVVKARLHKGVPPAGYVAGRGSQ